MSVLKLLSWNIDGLGESGVQDRARAAVKIIVEYSPDLLFLQEVVGQNCDIFSSGLAAAGYQSKVNPPASGGYYTMCYFKASSVEFIAVERLKYHGEGSSRMMRDILKIDVKYQGQRLTCLSSHLESTASESIPRIAQLTQLVEIACGCAHPSLIVGDLNMRDKEAEEAVFRYRRALSGAGKPPYVGLNDAYFHFNKPSDARITWVPPNVAQANRGCRFDRIYHNCHPGIQYSSLGLVGQRKVPGLGMTPSDHFGLTVGIRLLSREATATAAAAGTALRTGNVGKFHKTMTPTKGAAAPAASRPTPVPSRLESETVQSPVAAVRGSSSSRSSSSGALGAISDLVNWFVPGIAPVASAGRPSDFDEVDDEVDEDLKLALKLSREESQPVALPPSPPSLRHHEPSDFDEVDDEDDEDLKLALQLSRSDYKSGSRTSAPSSAVSNTVNSGVAVAANVSAEEVPVAKKRRINDAFLEAFAKRGGYGIYANDREDSEEQPQQVSVPAAAAPAAAAAAVSSSKPSSSSSHRSAADTTRDVEVIDLT